MDMLMEVQMLLHRDHQALTPIHGHPEVLLRKLQQACHPECILSPSVIQISVWLLILFLSDKQMQ